MSGSASAMLRSLTGKRKDERGAVLMASNGITMLRSIEAPTLQSRVAATGIRPVVDQVFGFDDASEAYAHLAAGGRHFGKIGIKLP